MSLLPIVPCRWLAVVDMNVNVAVKVNMQGGPTPRYLKGPLVALQLLFVWPLPLEGCFNVLTVLEQICFAA